MSNNDLQQQARAVSLAFHETCRQKFGRGTLTPEYAQSWFNLGAEFGMRFAAEPREKEIAELRRDKELLTVDLDKLIVQNGKLSDEVNDWRESAAKAAMENCGDEIRGDEHHCTCVGPLRHQAVRQAQRIVDDAAVISSMERIARLAVSLAEEFERAVAFRNPVGGMSVSPSGDFVSCAQLPSAVKRMEWWAREIRRAQTEWTEESEGV